MLKLSRVHKSFKQSGNVIHVLKGIDLEIGVRESLAVIGASGVGKSTLLNIMGTLEPPSEGTVRFNHRDVNRLDESDLCQIRNRDIGFVFQFHHLLPELNALENTMMPALIARFSRKEASQEGLSILEKVGLGQRLYHRVGELSGGEQQRVAIARALIMKPKLLLADEPTGNLDKYTGEGIGDLFLRFNRDEGLTMVIATHNQELASKMARQVEIVDGRIQ